MNENQGLRAPITNLIFNLIRGFFLTTIDIVNVTFFGTVLFCVFFLAFMLFAVLVVHIQWIGDLFIWILEALHNYWGLFNESKESGVYNPKNLLTKAQWYALVVVVFTLGRVLIYKILNKYWPEKPYVETDPKKLFSYIVRRRLMFRVWFISIGILIISLVVLSLSIGSPEITLMGVLLWIVAALVAILILSVLNLFDIVVTLFILGISNSVILKMTKKTSNLEE